MKIDEIGLRLALGNFKELNLIIKGDVDGSVEALSDSLQKLSTEEIAVHIVHKGVGAITESDVLLATASDAVILGFNVRPSHQASRLAENEGVEIKTIRLFTMQLKKSRAPGRHARAEDPGKNCCQCGSEKCVQFDSHGCRMLRVDGKINRTQDPSVREGIVTILPVKEQLLNWLH
jgi:hypothetical protein